MAQQNLYVSWIECQTIRSPIGPSRFPRIGLIGAAPGIVQLGAGVVVRLGGLAGRDSVLGTVSHERTAELHRRLALRSKCSER